MGLAEKRAIHEFQEKTFPELKAAIEKAADLKVEIAIQWETLAEPDYAHMYTEAFTKVYFRPLIDALTKICSDDMGKQAIKGALKKITICNSGKHYGGSAFSFTGGELKIDHQPVSNIDDVEIRTNYLVKLLEENI